MYWGAAQHGPAGWNAIMGLPGEKILPGPLEEKPDLPCQEAR
jgi:hypothetical protein